MQNRVFPGHIYQSEMMLSMRCSLTSSYKQLWKLWNICNDIFTYHLYAGLSSIRCKLRRYLPIFIFLSFIIFFFLFSQDCEMLWQLLPVSCSSIIALKGLLTFMWLRYNSHQPILLDMKIKQILLFKVKDTFSAFSLTFIVGPLYLKWVLKILPVRRVTCFFFILDRGISLCI